MTLREELEIRARRVAHLRALGREHQEAARLRRPQSEARFWAETASVLDAADGREARRRLDELDEIEGLDLDRRYDEEQRRGNLEVEEALGEFWDRSAEVAEAAAQRDAELPPRIAADYKQDAERRRRIEEEMG